MIEGIEIIEGKLEIPILPPKCKVTGKLVHDFSTGKHRLIMEFPLTFSCIECNHETHNAEVATKHFNDNHATTPKPKKRWGLF